VSLGGKLTKGSGPALKTRTVPKKRRLRGNDQIPSWPIPGKTLSELKGKRDEAI